jgi:CcmD family protein
MKKKPFPVMPVAWLCYAINTAGGLLTSTACFAQENNVEMADELRSTGKIYVVVGVLLTILFGVILYLVSIDRKLTTLEKKLTKK